MNATARSLFLSFALVGWAAPAAAQNHAAQAQHVANAPRFSAAAGRSRLLQALRGSNTPHYERTLPNGAQRVYAHVDQAHLPAVERALDDKSNVLEILHIGAPGANHTLAVFDRKLIHTQFNTTSYHWRLRSWGYRLYAPHDPLYSAQIQLTAHEAGKLRTLLDAAYAEQGPEERAGTNWVDGHLKTSLGNRSINCVSTWSEMPVGEHGEPLYQLLGLPHSYSGDPHGFQKALETQANDRVIGVSTYGGSADGFGQNHEANLFNAL